MAPTWHWTAEDVQKHARTGDFRVAEHIARTIHERGNWWTDD